MIGLNIFKKLALTAGLSLTLMSSASAAVEYIGTQDINGNFTSIIGARGIEVDADGDTVKELYSVEFLDGDFATLFAGSGGGIDFGPVTSSNAQSFADALIGQVFTGIYANDTDLTQGCTASFLCFTTIPYDVRVRPGKASLLKSAVITTNTSSMTAVTGSNNTLPFDTSGVTTRNFAQFSPQQAVAAVPEPSTYAMLLAGLGLLGFAKRRQEVR